MDGKLKWRITTFTKFVLMVLLIMLLNGCNRKLSNLSQHIRTSNDKVSIEYLNSPGILGSDGILIRFERFSIRSSFRSQCSFEELPKLKNNYDLFLLVPGDVPHEAIEDSLVQTTMTNSKGTKLWEIETPLKEWRVSEVEDKRYYYFMVFGEKPLSCSFIPENENKYVLEVSYTPSLASKEFENESYFLLQSGGFK